ncbi:MULTISPECIES: STAS domain-containing protein [unclassified Rhizobium]|uniref:STAS domain-containing protein n=1 Tax=unclassified Rhizobium TaxID=2613769 RepID=UPI00104C43EF|nr:MULTISPECIES: STAS domain-containing protein [unclassified Rhizobium]MBB3395168.1 MFS superfamily sulfate permease-like transporter [Rhizobium sp. BK060]MBB4167242.1 MFS superfamily sulfate permease-like transporter [Rhizobium sp. BK538]TCM78024.1 STAS domain-containing protein [Rhizobium sp. BK068]
MSTFSQYNETVSFNDALLVRNISEIFSKITTSIDSNNSLVIDISEHAEADLSFIQLIESARRQAKAQNKSITLSSPAKGHVLKVLERAGFLDAFNPDDAKFWLHKEVTP